MRENIYLCTMNNYTALLYLDNRKVRKDGTFPLVFRIYKDRQNYISISSGYYLLEKDWDENKRSIKNSYKGSNSVSWLNNYLQKQKANYIDILGKLAESKILSKISSIELKEILQGKTTKNNLKFFEYTERLIEEQISIQRVGNARIYKSVLNVLKSYRKNKDIRFEEITYDFLKKFEIHFFSKGSNSYNGLSVYMRTIRAIYNRAIKDNIINKESYPFENYKIKSEPTSKRAISQEDIKKIEKLDLKASDPLFHTRNYFLFSFYLMGMPFTDIAHLKKENIIGNRIQYSRQKTNKKYDIEIHQKGLEIIKFYSSKFPDAEHIFPIINRIDIVEEYKDIEWARNRYNKKLRKIAELCGIDKNLTSYVSRHSFATLAKNKGIPITAISEMLGHENIKTTQVYLDSLPSDVIDKYHRDILGD